MTCKIHLLSVAIVSPTRIIHDVLCTQPSSHGELDNSKPRLSHFTIFLLSRLLTSALQQLHRFQLQLLAFYAALPALPNPNCPRCPGKAASIMTEASSCTTVALASRFGYICEERSYSWTQARLRYWLLSIYAAIAMLFIFSAFLLEVGRSTCRP